MARAALMLAILPLPLAAQERMSLSCVGEGEVAVQVTLWNPSEATPPIHCVTSTDLSQIAACAPDGGWGLTEPDVPGDLLGMATDSKVINHVGGKFFARVGLLEFVASASIGAGLPLALEIHDETFWRMQVTLATGAGVVETVAGQTPIQCERL